MIPFFPAFVNQFLFMILCNLELRVFSKKRIPVGRNRAALVLCCTCVAAQRECV